MSVIRIPTGTSVYFGITTRHPTSGIIQSADETPHFWVFEESNDTGVIVRQPMVPRIGFSGVYRGNFVASTGQNFSPEKWYHVLGSAKVNGIIDMNIVREIFLEKNIYFADIFIDVDSTGSVDEYSVGWYKDDTPITTPLTSPTIQVIKRSDGSDLISSSSMTQIGSTGALKYTEAVAANRISTGESYIIRSTAVIDGSVRTAQRIIGRDN